MSGGLRKAGTGTLPSATRLPLASTCQAMIWLAVVSESAAMIVPAVEFSAAVGEKTTSPSAVFSGAVAEPKVLMPLWLEGHAVEPLAGLGAVTTREKSGPL